jgi:hypothetical protein
MADPPIFYGEAEEVETFLRHIEETIYLNGAALPDDYSKVIFISHHFDPKSSAERWYSGIRKSHPELLKDVNSFVSAFPKYFGDPNLTKKMQEKLEKLRQNSRSCVKYAADFRKIMELFGLLKKPNARRSTRGWTISPARPSSTAHAPRFTTGLKEMLLRSTMVPQLSAVHKRTTRDTTLTTLTTLIRLTPHLLIPLHPTHPLPHQLHPQRPLLPTTTV